MITLFITLLILCCLLGVAFRLTGALLSAMLWLFVKLPLAVVFFSIGIAFCCTLILIPLGVMMMKGAGWLLIPRFA